MSQKILYNDLMAIVKSYINTQQTCIRWDMFIMFTYSISV